MSFSGHIRRRLVFVLCRLNILAVQVNDGGSGGAWKLREWPEVLFPCCVQSTEVYGP